NCNDVNCNGEGLVYSRRIGRAPELAGTYNDNTSAAFTRILGAGKLTGRLPGGLTIGALDAVTQHVTGVGGATIEPTSNYGVVRLRQDLRGGESSVGGIITAVDRDNDAFTSPYLRGSAYVGATDFRHRFPGGKWEINGSLDLSHVSGSAQVIAATQRDAVHYYQRPDAGLGVDSTRTSLSGDAEELQFSKVSGNVIGQTSYQRRSPGFEINDLGYLQRADQQSWSTWVGFDDRKAIVPSFWVNYWRGDGGRSHSLTLMPEVDFKLASRVTAAIIPNYTRTSNDVQPLGQHATRYVFAHLEQKQLGVTMRFTYPFTASATLQVSA